MARSNSGGADSFLPNAEILNIRADYTLNVMHDHETALAQWANAIELRPGEPQYRINRARVLIALNREREAREDIAALRRMGVDNEEAARNLEARMRRGADR